MNLPIGQGLIDAEGLLWEVRGIVGDGMDRRYLLVNAEEQEARSVQVVEIAEHYSLIHPTDSGPLPPK